MTSPSSRSWSWQSVPWHPALLALAIVLAFWSEAGVSPYAGVRSLIVAVLATVAATALATAITRNRHIGGVAVTALIVLLYTKHLVRLVGDTGSRMPTYLLILWLVAMVLAAALGTRLMLRAARSLTWTRATDLLNKIAVVLLVATIGAGVINGSLAHGLGDLEQGGGLEGGASSTPDARPDIYVLLVDGYPRADVLAHAFDYDNSAFIAALENRGFRVASQSHSDYLWTHLSLTTLLHMAYIEQIEALEPVVAGRVPLYPALYDAVNNNPAFDVAREDGYQVVGISGGFEQLAPRGADVFLDSGSMSEFELKLLNSTFLGQVVSALAPKFAASQHADRIKANLRFLEQVARTPRSEPRLVFAHIPTPHQPTVFRANGEIVPVPIDDYFYADGPLEKGEPLDEFTRKYRDHLGYLNELLIQTLDAIVDSSTNPPVIVLVADHGSASRVDWTVTQPSEADPADLLERTATLFAAVTPGKANVFPDDLSPVDLFRHLFDAYAGTTFGPASPPPGGGQIPPVDASVIP